MDQREIASRLHAKIGQAVSVSFDGHTETLTIVSVNSEGFVARALPSRLGESASEFWIAFADVSELGEAAQ
jgi:hypothetical protein